MNVTTTTFAQRLAGQPARRPLGNRRLVALAAAAATLLLALPESGWAVPVFVNNDPNGDNCLSAANATVYRDNPGPTNLPGMTGNGPLSGQGSGTYGWISGCASQGDGQAYLSLGSFANAGVNGGVFLHGTTAIGFQASAIADWTVALGAQALANAPGAIALGTGSVATAANSTAIGGGGSSVLAVADSTTASGSGSIAIGVNATKGAQAAAADSIALGGESSVAAGATSGMAIGRAANVQGAFGVAMGDGITSGATGNNVAIGSEGTTANSLDASGGAVAIGRGQKATGNGAVAIGDPNVANGNGAVAIGADNTAAGDAAGTTAADGAVAIGNANAAIGTGNIAIGSTSNATGTGSTALGVGAGATADNAIAFGTGANAAQAGAVALGAGSVTAAAVGTASTTIRGVTYNFAGTAPTSTVSVGSVGAERTITNVAAGRLTSTSTDAVNGSQLFASIQAITDINTQSGLLPNNWIIGSPTAYAAPSSTGTNSTAAGSGAVVNANNSVAVGTGANATVDNSVALGNGSTTAAAAPSAGTTLRGTTYAFAGATPAGVVSVGSAGNERQIQNVAAGQLSATSTDAVNGSQLFATNQAINTAVVSASAGINVTTAATGTGVATGTSVANVAAGGTATYTAGNNMVLTQSGTNVAFALSSNPVFTSISIFGGPVLNSSGINAGGKSITNVGAAVNGTDAVNLNQLNAALAAATANARAEIDRVGRNAYAGVASAMAMESAPYVPGKTTMTAGVGYYQNQGGAAVALRRTADNGRWSITGGVAPSSGGVAARLGVTGVLE